MIIRPEDGDKWAPLLSSELWVHLVLIITCRSLHGVRWVVMVGLGGPDVCITSVLLSTAKFIFLTPSRLTPLETFFHKFVKNCSAFYTSHEVKAFASNIQKNVSSSFFLITGKGVTRTCPFLIRGGGGLKKQLQKHA